MTAADSPIGGQPEALEVVVRRLLEVTRQQVEHAIAGDCQALLDGAARHEALLGELARSLEALSAGADRAALRPILQELLREREKLRTLLEAEAARLAFMVRALTPARPGDGYPAQWRSRLAGSVLNRRA